MKKQIYTLGIWTVIKGMETEFIKEWESFAKWTQKNVTGTGEGYLLQDLNDCLRFISYGNWDNESSIEKWRSSDEFKNFVNKIKKLCSDFQPNTLNLVAKTL